ncbi:MAG TPA: B12-binding domain-containing protein [Acidimicrobiia bacterium]|nr:B12-binding domain-containing protein [Acidimicrobiia bacterium]
MTSEPPLTISDAAQRLGVHYMTVYRYIRLGMLPARKEGSEWRIDPADLKRLDTSPSVPARKRSAPWHTRLQARMLAGDEAGSWGVAEAAIRSGMEPRDFYCDVLTPVLHTIGELWQNGEIGVEDEHLASNVASALIGRLGPRFASRGRTKGTVVTAMPAGERHDLGLAMLGDILRSDGYRVLNLGADTPASALVAALRDVDDISAIALSVVNSERLDTAATLIMAVRESVGEVPVLAGGAAVPDEQSAQQLGADGWAGDARQVGPIISAIVSSNRQTR